MINYRPALPADIPELNRIRLAVRENRLSDPSRITGKDYSDYLTDRGRGWLAEEDGRVLGFAIADLQERNIWALFVDPDHEGKGIGRQLHRIMLDWYFDQTSETVWLSTEPGSRAEKFYRRAGWTPCGFYGQGELKFEMTAQAWAQQGQGCPLPNSKAR